MSSYLLAIDQGTTSSRAIVFDKSGQRCGVHQLEFEQFFPHEGWVEHDPEQIWQTTLTSCQQALVQARLTAKDIAAIGISNQRETTVVWDKKTGECIAPAIVWQDRRTTAYCKTISEQAGVDRLITEKTGLLVDPYFSASKLHWILDKVAGARQRAEKGELLFGTIDTFLLWRLTQGNVHATDATNASRTLLFNIKTQQWDDELCALFDIPKNLLPEVRDCADHYGETTLFGAPIPICGIAGDQQAATVGQACFQPGMIKSTYGTGCFVLLNTGDEIVQSKNRLLSTVAYRLNNKVTYGLEGSIFVAGAAVQWLRDAVHIIHKASETESMAVSVPDNGGVYLVPAFTGLGAPYWDPQARGALLGLTRDSRVEHIVRAALEAVCYQTQDLMQAMSDDYQSPLATLRVDGGMVANDWLLQFLSDMLALEVERPLCIETSALGAAYLAGLGCGLYQSLEDIANQWHLDKRFDPHMPDSQRETLYCGWKKAVGRIMD